MDIPIDFRTWRQRAVCAGEQGRGEERREEEEDKVVGCCSEDDLVEVEGEGRQRVAIGEWSDEADDMRWWANREGVVHIAGML